jgi:hypothetical protein
MGADFHLSFGCSEELHGRITAYATDNGLSNSQVVRCALRAFLPAVPTSKSDAAARKPVELPTAACHTNQPAPGNMRKPNSTSETAAAEPETFLPRSADEILDTHAPGWRDQPNPELEAAMAKARERQRAAATTDWSAITDWRSLPLWEIPPRDVAERLWASLRNEVRQHPED